MSILFPGSTAANACPFGIVTAEGTGADSAAEVIGQGGISGFDFADGVADARGDGRPGAIGIGVEFARSLAEAQGLGQIVGKLVNKIWRRGRFDDDAATLKAELIEIHID